MSRSGREERAPSLEERTAAPDLMTRKQVQVNLKSETGNAKLKVLLIEDNPGDARLIREMLSESKVGVSDLECADRLSSGLARLDEGGIDVVLLDLSLPDSQGLNTLVEVQARAPGVPIVVLTGMGDESLATEAMRAGAQDYLVKGQTDGNLLARSARYAIERHRLLAELERARQRQQDARELHSLEQLSASGGTDVTARLYGATPLRESVPDVFDRLARRYGGLLDQALEQRAYRVEHNISGELRGVAEELGFLRARPRDVVEIHSTTLKGTMKAGSLQRSQACIEEGRLLVLQLMGYLASFYRSRSLGAEIRISGKEEIEGGVES